MSDQRKMGMQSACLVVATMLVVSNRGSEAVVVHAVVNVGADNSEFLQTLFKQMDMLVSKEQQDSNVLSQGDSQEASTPLQSAPSVTIKGNITDPERRLTLTFTVQASRTFSSASEVDDDDDEEDDEWRSSSGVLTPLVDVVEPYFLSFVELVFNGILSTVISNFLEGTNPLGDVRLV